MTQRHNATVIGSGVMGAALAELLVSNQYQTTVWNRTTHKTKPLADKGATVAGSAAEAAQASGVAVVCISDYGAVNNTISQPEVLKALSGKTIINLTTGIPSEANRMNELLSRHNVAYLDGAILSFADQMGKHDTTILLSGSAHAFEQYRGLLGILGGNLKYLGTKPGAAAALDQTILSYMYGALTGFFHGVLIAEKEGIDISLMGEIINNTTPGIGHFIKHEAEQIQANHFEVTLSSVAMNARAVQNVYNTSKDYGLDLKFPELLHHYYSQAEKSGLYTCELASLIKVFRG